MPKTKKNYKINKGGKVIASGGCGCVFNPALKCEGDSKRESKKISKLMTQKQQAHLNQLLPHSRQILVS